MTTEERQKLEAELRLLLAHGSVESAARRIIRGYGPEILGFLLNVMNDPDAAEEVYQQFALDMWRGLQSFEPRAMVRTWAYCVARNACARYYQDKYRKQCRRLLTREQEELLAETWGQVNSHQAASDERVERIRRQLSPEDRELLTLHLDRELTLHEAAAIMGISHAAARQRFHRIKARIRSLMATQ